MGNGSGLIAFVTLPDQRANVLRDSVPTLALPERHGQYLGRGRFLPIVSGATEQTWRPTWTVPPEGETSCHV